MEKKLDNNPFKKDTKAYIFLENSNTDFNTGFSRIVPLSQLPSKLQLGNGGDWCRDDGPLGKWFNIIRNKKKGKIISVQLSGYKKNVFNKNIHIKIYEKLKNKRCRVLDVGKSIEVDHKDGRYDAYKIDLNITDCQPLHTSANKAKRQHCRKCREKGIRYDATKLGYALSQYIGTKEYTGSCIGCYWFDPYEFNKQISKQYKKEK